MPNNPKRDADLTFAIDFLLVVIAMLAAFFIAGCQQPTATAHYKLHSVIQGDQCFTAEEWAARGNR